MQKPIPRTEFMANAAAEWDALMLAYEATLPRHALIGPYLAANPVEGVEAVDRSDGLGVRAVGWPEGMPHPDVEAWVAKREALAALEAEAQGKREAEQAAADAEAEKAQQAEKKALAAKIATIRSGKASSEDIADLLARVLL